MSPPQQPGGVRPRSRRAWWRHVLGACTLSLVAPLRDAEAVDVLGIGPSTASAADVDDARLWTSQFRRRSDFCEVEVVDVMDAGVARRYLRCGSVILGAKFLDPEYAGQSPFSAFALMQGAIQFLAVQPRRALVLGLGAGLVPTALRWSTPPLVVDVVEMSEAVVLAASRFFDFKHTEGSHGRTYVRDAVDFVEEAAAMPAAHRYDVVLHDLYNGSSHAVSPVTLVAIRDKLLRTDGAGVLFVNVVGFQRPSSAAVKFGDPYQLTISVARSLADVFECVYAFSEAPPQPQPGEDDEAGEGDHLLFAGNILFVASSRTAPAATMWAVPSTGNFKDPPEHSHDWVVANFVHWELLGLGSALLRQTAGREVWRPGEEQAAASRLRAAMWVEVRSLLPRAAWRGDFLDEAGALDDAAASAHLMSADARARSTAAEL